MIMDDTTAAYKIPLPHPDNELETDVIRLRAALLKIDQALKEIAELQILTDQNLQQQITDSTKRITIINALASAAI